MNALEKSVDSVRRLSELNLRTFETLATKQVEIMQGCINSGIKQTEVFSEVRDVKDMLAAQSELAGACVDKLNSSLSETADILKTAQEELTGLIEEVVVDAKDNAEKVVNLGKKGVEQAVKPKRTKKAA